MKLGIDDLKTKSSNLDEFLLEEKKRTTLLKELRQEIQRAKATDVSDYQRFGVKYFRRPDLYARECIEWPEGQSLTDYQGGILRAVHTEEWVAVRGPRGLGKTALAAIAINHFALTREALGLNWKIIATAGSYVQLRRFLWPECQLFANRIKWDKVGRSPYCTRTEMLSDALQMSNGEAFCLSPDKPELAEGLHADHVLVIIDEAKSVDKRLIRSMEGFFSSANKDKGKYAFCLAISTPGSPLGEFYNIFKREKGFEHWHPIVVSLEQALAAGVITEAHVERMRNAYGEDSSIYQQQVLGNFFSDDADSLIPLDWIEAAVLRHEEQQVYGSGESDSEW